MAWQWQEEEGKRRKRRKRSKRRSVCGCFFFSYLFALFTVNSLSYMVLELPVCAGRQESRKAGRLLFWLDDAVYYFWEIENACKSKVLREREGREREREGTNVDEERERERENEYPLFSEREKQSIIAPPVYTVLHLFRTVRFDPTAATLTHILTYTHPQYGARVAMGTLLQGRAANTQKVVCILYSSLSLSTIYFVFKGLTIKKNTRWTCFSIKKKSRINRWCCLCCWCYSCPNINSKQHSLKHTHRSTEAQTHTGGINDGKPSVWND